ncbi:MAG: heavy metal translocating P-type ATPase metal-binding domain-containing protein [Gammaproteobacteria bacterium]
MAHVEYRPPCVLCGQPVEIDAFTLNGPRGSLKFCCAGCQSIYRLLNEEGTSTITKHPLKKEEETKK